MAGRVELGQWRRRGGQPMTGVRLDVGAYVEIEQGVTATEGLEDGLCRVVRAEGNLRDIRRVSATTGALEGIEVRFLAAELRPARPSVQRWHEALRVRAGLTQWDRAVAADDEDVDTLAVLLAGTQRLVELILDADPTELAEVAVCGYVSARDGAQVVEIDTTEDTGRVRVVINDGTVYDGDPCTDAPPGAHYDGPGWWAAGGRQWKVRSLMTGETTTFEATSEADATAQYLDTVTSNLLVWQDSDGDDRCDECGAATGEGVSPQHGPACSLHPDNVVDIETGQRSQ